MNKRVLLIAWAIVLALAVACSTGTAAATVTLIPASQPTTLPPVRTGTLIPPTETQPTAANTTAPLTAVPSSLPSFPTPTRIVPQPGPTSVGVSQVKVYLIAMNDGGKAGPLVGCGDSIIAVDRTVQPTQAPLRAALQALFSIKDQFYGQSGLYNALYSSDLQIDRLTIDDTGLATIMLTGQMSLAGECDDPRFQAQIEYTAMQFPTVKSLAIFVNGKPLSSLLGGK